MWTCSQGKKADKREGLSLDLWSGLRTPSGGPAVGWMRSPRQVCTPALAPAPGRATLLCRGQSPALRENGCSWKPHLGPCVQTALSLSSGMAPTRAHLSSASSAGTRPWKPRTAPPTRSCSSSTATSPTGASSSSTSTVSVFSPPNEGGGSHPVSSSPDPLLMSS